MIDREKISQIEQLLATGHSQRKIARLAGVSRNTVATVADRLSHAQTAAEEALSPTRCPNCGGMVYLPCRLCSVRAVMERRRLRRAWLKRAYTS
jgi:hypothetical protein